MGNFIVSRLAYVSSTQQNRPIVVDWQKESAGRLFMSRRLKTRLTRFKGALAPEAISQSGGRVDCLHKEEIK